LNRASEMGKKRRQAADDEEEWGAGSRALAAQAGGVEDKRGSDGAVRLLLNFKTPTSYAATSPSASPATHSPEASQCAKHTHW